MPPLDLTSLQSTHGLDAAITKGKVYILDSNKDYEFLVRLPSEYNKAYQNQVSGALKMSYDDEGGVVMGATMLEFREAQRAAFLAHCLMSINGEPVPKEFSDNFTRVIDELFALANDDAAAIDGAVKDAVKK